MSHFIFQAKKPTGETYSGEKDAPDRYELYKLLHENGDEILSFKEGKEKKGMNKDISIPFIGKRVKTIEKINFARNLGSMLQAGLALSRALTVLERQSKNKALKDILNKLMTNINQGMTFSDALSEHKKVFPEVFIAMVHAGEQSGTLADSLKVVASQMDSSYSLERRIRGALMYPAVIVFAMLLIAILMFVFVVPTLLKTFTELNVELPFTTQIVLGISTLLQNHGLPVLVVVIMIISALFYWKKTPSGKRVIHAGMLRIPLIGPLVQEVNTARTARTLSSLLGSGVDVVESIIITSAVVQNIYFREILVKAASAIKTGELMSKTFDNNPKFYPVFFSEMMSVGEETGKIGEMLMGVANYYEEDVSQKTKDMSTIIEPFLLLLIGAAVGFFAVAMIQPMYSLVNVI